MTAVNGLYNVECNTEMLKRRYFMKHYFNMSSIKAVIHELVLKIDSLTAAAFISLQHVLLLAQGVLLVRHNTILKYVEGTS
jgi:hypothetical protein